MISDPSAPAMPRPSSPTEERVERPWGWFENLGNGDGYLVKRLLIRSGARISLQKHRHRSEHWVVVAGEGLLQIDGDTVPATPGTSVFIPQGSLHRATAGSRDLVLVEVQRGAVLREDDIERFDDDFGRAGDFGPPGDSGAG
ncbi:MAG: phosphomannose isomerase type II C-terminal cupin domain [Cyanobium sp. LacPavin_0920_WC12_MAG_62_9]|nr:phosphomannose isomerase type II C-terminal cupin domain [Cyanobium sp. LacPavin_0920_WC12_MAG_62_9]